MSENRIFRLAFVLGVGWMLGTAVSAEARRSLTLRERYGGASIQRQYEIGKEFLARGDIPNAIKMFQMAEERVPFKRVLDKEFVADLYYQLAHAYFLYGRRPFFSTGDDRYYTTALDYGAKSLKANPRHWRAMADLGTIYADMKDLEKADEFFTRAESLADHRDPLYRDMHVRHQKVRILLQVQQAGENNP